MNTPKVIISKDREEPLSPVVAEYFDAIVPYITRMGWSTDETNEIEILVPEHLKVDHERVCEFIPNARFDISYQGYCTITGQMASIAVFHYLLSKMLALNKERKSHP